MIESCPYIEELDISIPLEDFANHNLDSNYKLDHLLEVKITNLTGSSAEIQLIEYLLAISSVLENLLFKSFYRLDTVSELQLSRALLRLPRASTKACAVCLK